MYLRIAGILAAGPPAAKMPFIYRNGFLNGLINL